MRLTETFTKEFYNSEKKLLIYGAGNYGEIALGGLKEIGLTPDYFVDKNHAGELYHQIPVISPQEINRFSQDVFLVASLNYFGEIVATLIKNEVEIFYDIEYLIEICPDEFLNEYTLDEKRNIDKYKNVINNYNKEIQKLEEELAKAANDYNNSYTGKFVGTLSWPLSKSSPGYKTITSYYGNRQVPIAGATSDHRAIDIGVPTGTPVLSAGNGIVISTGYNSARGYFVIIKHADNLYTLYQHLSKILVSRGQAVSTGKTIAKSGSSGIGTGPHLHFEVRKSQYYGSEVNPLDYCHW